MNTLDLKNIFLKVLIASVGISVAIGIMVVLFGTKEQSARIFLTSLTITIASFSMFLNGVFFEKLSLKILPVLGFLITPICALLCIYLIWGSSEYRPVGTALVLLGANFSLVPLVFYFERKGARTIPALGAVATAITTAFILSLIWGFTSNNDAIEKFFMIAYIIALACFYLSLVMQVNLVGKFRWALIADQICVWALAATASYIVLFVPSGSEPLEIITRLITILSILITALTVLIPIFHFLSRSQFKPSLPDTANIDREIEELKFRITELEELKARLENPTSSIS